MDAGGFSQKLIISVKEARKILGEKYDHMTDEQIEDMIIQLDEIATLSMRDDAEKLCTGEKPDMA